MKISSVLIQYVETALWSSTHSNDEPMDSLFSIQDLSAEALAQAETDLNSFIEKAGSLLDDTDLETAAHDFWLTRNRHGVGFWDGDYPKAIGEALTDLSHSFGETDIYQGDDDKLYFSR